MLFVRGTIRIFLTGLLVLVAGTENLFARQLHNLPRLFFDQITTQNGLSGNEITCLYQDNRGFLWIGTHNGLNEYDGRNITTFHHNRFDPHSIISNYINNITEDDRGYLWLGTNDGISRFDLYNHQSVNFSHDAANPLSLNDNKDCRVYFDKQGTLWVGNESGLSYLNRKNGRFIHVQILPDSLNKPVITAAGSFLEDQEGRFWIGTFSGLVLYDRTKHTFKRYTLYPNGKNNSNPVTTIYKDHAGHFWVGFWGSGLCLFDPVTGSFKKYKWNEKNKYSSTVNIVFSLAETQTTKGDYILWAATSEGLLRINNYSFLSGGQQSFLKSITHIRPDAADPHSLSDDEVMCLLSGKQNIMWVGTKNGLDEYIYRNQHFSDIFPFKGNITRIWVDSLHHPLRYFISSWYGNGLTELNEKMQIIHIWHLVPPDAGHVDNGQISDVLLAKDGTIWIGTFNGLYSYNEKTQRFIPYLHKINKKNSPASNRVTALAEDKDGKLWIGTYDGGLNVYDPVKHLFVHYQHQSNDTSSLCNDLVWNIYVDRQNQIWIATYDGLSLFDAKRNCFINYRDQKGNVNSLKGSSVSDILEDQNQVYWIATNKGLNRFVKKDNRFSLYATEEGLKNNEIISLVQDNDGLLWMCDGNSISSFNTVRHTFINYNELNGFPFGAAGSLAKTPSGDILIGGNNILIKFAPSDFKRTSVPPPVYITGIEVSGNSITINRNPKKLQPLLLHYPDNNFSVTFSTPEFFNGKAVKYAYYMDGVDKKWIQAGDRNFVSYSGLAPGHYIFLLRAANSDGVWNKTGTRLMITVLPPFWETWWFRLAALIMIALIIYSIFIYRVVSIRKQEAMKTAINKQMADMRLTTLRSRMNPHFMFNALNSIQECIYTGQSNVAYKYLSKFSHLVRMILERSEQSFITVSQEAAMLKLYLELESLRFQQSFIYSINYNEVEADFLKIPPMLIQPFVENAIWHGLLHKEGEKKLLITFRADDNFVNVIIEDNGIGRDAARRLKMKKLEEQHSLGIHLVSEQLESVSKLSNKVANMQVEDLFYIDPLTEKQMPSGTRVTLFIPIVT